jgi:hypothetical protein
MKLASLVPVVVFIFCFFAALLAAVFLATDMLDKAEWLKRKVPWLAKFLERRESLPLLLLMVVLLLVLNGYELMTKEAGTPERQCWESQHPIAINPYVVSRYPEAKLATEVDVYCSYRINAPLRVDIEFDKELVMGQAIIAGESYQVNGPRESGKRLYGDFGAPDLPAYHLLLATVYTKEWTNVLKWKVEEAP